ncbi:MAG: twin-arginine translocase TatA/TatE family subunit [Myxococcales bacterium]
MLGLSMTEVIIILGLALILLGPDQLPSIAKTIGKGMREIRKATDDLKSTFDQEMVRMDEMVNVNEQPRSLQPVGPANPTGQSTPPADPAAARAAARRSAHPPRLSSASMDPMSLTQQQQAQLRLVTPPGAVAQDGGAAGSASPSAPSASSPADGSKAVP